MHREEIDAVFAGIGVWARIYERYPHVLSDTRETYHPLALMVQRWDGTLGFPGGAVDQGESVADALRRELWEEVRLALPMLGMETRVHTAKNEDGRGLRLHFFVPEPRVATVAEMRRMIREACGAEHAFAEGSPVWVHLAVYDSSAPHVGLTRTMTSGALAPGVREELAILCERMNRTRPQPSEPIDMERVHATMR